MATYTVLLNSEKKNRSEVVIEINVPAGNNSSGVPWQTVVAELRAIEQSSPDSIPTSNPRNLTDTAYISSLDSGSLVEVTMSVEYDGNLSNADKLIVLDASVVSRVAEFTSEFSSEHEFYGTVRTV